MPAHVSEAVRSMVDQFNQSIFVDETFKFCGDYLKGKYPGFLVPDSKDHIVEACSILILKGVPKAEKEAIKSQMPK
jgi:hypothetical protein